MGDAVRAAFNRDLAATAFSNMAVNKMGRGIELGGKDAAGLGRFSKTPAVYSSTRQLPLSLVPSITSKRQVPANPTLHDPRTIGEAVLKRTASLLAFVPCSTALSAEQAVSCNRGAPHDGPTN